MANPDGPERPSKFVFECKPCKVERSVRLKVEPLKGVDPPGIDVTCPKCGKRMEYREEK